ncbi:MAG TPA: hypothetical protein VLV88_12465 [Terriglobales bacterium]|nr:hypothetical protein [Terriglobales bacterium]
MDFLLAITLAPLVAVPMLLAFSLRDWVKARKSSDIPRPSAFGLAVIITLFCEWLIPLSISIFISALGLGVDFSSTGLAALLLVWLIFVVIAVGTSLFTLRGSARVLAFIAGLVLCFISALVVKLALGGFDMT